MQNKFIQLLITGVYVYLGITLAWLTSGLFKMLILNQQIFAGTEGLYYLFLVFIPIFTIYDLFVIYILRIFDKFVLKAIFILPVTLFGGIVSVALWESGPLILFLTHTTVFILYYFVWIFFRPNRK